MASKVWANIPLTLCLKPEAPQSLICSAKLEQKNQYKVIQEAEEATVKFTCACRLRVHCKPALVGHSGRWETVHFSLTEVFSILTQPTSMSESHCLQLYTLTVYPDLQIPAPLCPDGLTPCLSPHYSLMADHMAFWVLLEALGPSPLDHAPASPYGRFILILWDSSKCHLLRDFSFGPVSYDLHILLSENLVYIIYLNG
jgi:hypothetical protein